MGSAPDRLRAFVALELPGELRQAIGRVIGGLAGLSASRAARVRWTPTDNLHVTLKFLGSVEATRIPALEEALAQVASSSGGPLRLGIEGGGCFPDPRRPTVLWLGLRGDVARLTALAAAVEQRLRGLGFPGEAHPFAPHLTVGRLRDGREGRGVAAAMAASAPRVEGDFLARELVLFRSETLPEGARYTALHRVALGHS